jgi:hypothetical protein
MNEGVAEWIAVPRLAGRAMGGNIVNVTFSRLGIPLFGLEGADLEN